MITACALAFVSLASGFQESPKSGSLKEAARNRFKVGVALATDKLTDRQYTSLVIRHFNSVTPENSLKPSSMLVSPGVYNFTESDKFVAFANSRRLEITGHTLVWHEQSPSFLYQDASGNPLSRTVALSNMRNHIHAVVGRYKGKVKGWDVVNEAVADSGGMRQTPAYRAIGPDYVLKAFEYAAEADPNAELYYNDYNIELNYKRPSALNLITSLRTGGAKLTAIGIQGHYNLSSSLNEIKGGIQQYINNGYNIMISELDVDVLPSSGNPYTAGLPSTIQNSLTQWYGNFFTYVATTPQIKRVTFWGLTDGNSWLNNWPISGRTNHPLLFDRNYRPKPAYNEVIRVLGTSSTPIP